MRLQFREGWSSLLLLLGILMSVVWSLETARWADGMNLIQWAVLVALLWGVITAKSRLPAWFVFPCMAVISVAWSLFLASRTLLEKLTWNQRVLEMYERYYVWFVKAMNGNTNSDNLIFLMECLVVLFWITFLATWFVYRRKQTWAALLPAGVVLVINIYYAQGEHGWYMFQYLLCSLLFVVRTHLTNQEVKWQTARMTYSRLIGFDFLRDGAVFSVLVILLAQALPAAAANPQLAEAMQNMEGPWMAVREKWGQLFASLNYKPEPNGTGFFGSSMTLGGPLHLNQTPIMTIQQNGGRYWAAMTYDKYNGKGWENTDPVNITLRSVDRRFENVPFSQRELMTQTVQVLFPTSQLIGAPMAIAWGRPVVAQVNRDPLVQPDSDVPFFISTVYSAVPTRANDKYTVLSLVPRADNKQLRKAGTDYPKWITDRYLTVPSTVPQRVRTLAQRVTEKAPSNFDKAVFLEQFLREFQYNEFVQAPPSERDVVDYFLFTSKQGYCNYYASAMAIMLRSIGIPARVISGYARGEFDSESNLYMIRESDSHMWVEAFFPGYGWIVFEPTASHPELERIEGVDSNDDSSSSENPESPRNRDEDRLSRFDDLNFIDELDPSSNFFGSIALEGPFAGVGYLTILGLVVALVGLLAAAISWQRHISRLTVMEAQYESLQRYARWLGAAPRIGHTPMEFASNLATRVPMAAAAIMQVANLYVRSLFAREKPTRTEEQAAKQLWPSLRKNFVREIFNRVLQKFMRAPEKS